MTPIDIAGEQIEAQDWPEGNPHFVKYEGDDSGLLEFIDCKAFPRLTQCVALPQKYKGSSVEKFLCAGLINVLPIIAATARCHFLDKAAEIDEWVYDNTPGLRPTMWPDAEKQKQKEAYLASAAKWARIGRKGAEK